MSLIMNASCETQQVSAFGNHFTLKSGQIKNFDSRIAEFLANMKQDYGLVPLPEEFEDPAYQLTDEGKAKLAAAKAYGVSNRVKYLKQVAYNETVSLRMDFDAKNMKADPRSLMSDGAIKMLEELTKYLDNDDEEQLQKVEKVKKLQEKLGKLEKE